MHTTTLITASFDTKRVQPPAFGDTVPAVLDGLPEPERKFHIQSADSFVVRQSANQLLEDRYGWRGYRAVTLPANQTADRTTLTAMEAGEAIGTITVGLDGAAGMNCEKVFPEEVAALRAQYGRICEFTKLAVDPQAGTNRVLAGLFHVAYIVAHRLRGFKAVVIEVNPRHVRFYERMLGGRVFGAERLNPLVDAPAVLLVIDFAYVAAQIALRAGRHMPNDRSLYSLAFTAQEEQGILGRLMAVQTPASPVVN
jgi:hypothetical protein